jgi:DNA-binding CsgD family transcriptional regulator
LHPPGSDEPVRLNKFETETGQFVVISLPTPSARTAQLTPAQTDVLHHLLAGRRDREIAKRRGTSPHTIAKQVRQLFRIFGVSSRTELIAQAR